MKWLLVLFLIPASALAAKDRQPWEIGLAANSLYLYSRTEGATYFNFDAGVFLKIPIGDRWQIKLADDAVSTKNHRFTIGADYNFSEDWLSSFYVGAGVGMGWQEGFAANSFYVERSRIKFGYVEAGKRFTLVQSWGLAYTPQLQLSVTEKGGADLTISPLNLSILF